MGEGEEQDETEAGGGCDGGNEEGGGGRLEDAEGTAKDELGVWDGVGRFEWDLSSLTGELTDGTRLWSGGERRGGGEKSNWRVMVDEEEGALDWGRRGDDGKGARAGDGRKRRNVVLGEVTGGRGTEEVDGEGCFPLMAGSVTRSRSMSAASFSVMMLGGGTFGGIGTVETVRECRFD